VKRQAQAAVKVTRKSRVAISPAGFASKSTFDTSYNI
jgi:hypothetical protein